MKLEFEIADLSKKELDAISTYRNEIKGKNPDVESLTKELRVLKTKRTNAYARFQQLVDLTK